MFEYEVVIENSQGHWRYVVDADSEHDAVVESKKIARAEGWNGFDLGIKVTKQ